MRLLMRLLGFQAGSSFRVLGPRKRPPLQRLPYGAIKASPGTLCAAHFDASSYQNDKISSPTTIWDIRKGDDGDFDKLVIFLGAIRAFTEDLTGRPEPNTIFKQKGKTLQSLLPQLPNAHVIFIQDQRDMDVTEPIGFASYNLRYTGFGPPFLHLEHLFVDPNCRSGGAGAALMWQLASIGQLHRCTHLEWNVNKENVRGVQFYTRLGAVHSPEQDSKTMIAMKWVPQFEKNETA